jgi:hypothetical protein
MFYVGKWAWCGLRSVSGGTIAELLPAGRLPLIWIRTSHLDRPIRETGFLRRALIPAECEGGVRFLRTGFPRLFLRHAITPLSGAGLPFPHEDDLGWEQ